MWERGRGREREKERELQVGSMLNMESNMGLDPTTLVSRPELTSRVTQPTEPPRHSRNLHLYGFLLRCTRKGMTLNLQKLTKGKDSNLNLHNNLILVYCAFSHSLP